MTVISQQVLSPEAIQLYQQGLLQHHKAPFGFELEFDATHQAEGVNPACGDEIVVKAKVISGIITEVAFFGDSCAICRASASMMCQHLVNQKVGQVEPVIESVIETLGASNQDVPQFSEALYPLIAVRKFPVRKQCAILPWRTFAVALTN
ncbi:iron-sulfur cluster assembly scaffold protein [Thalassotalea piscium]